MNPTLILLLVFVGAVLFRVGLFFSGLVDVVFLTYDSDQYVEQARSIVNSGTFSEQGAPSMSRTPGYPAFLALIIAAFGFSQLAITAVQVILDALTCVMVTHMALRLGLGRAGVALTALLAMTCVYTSVYSFELMTETLYTCALTFAIWVWPARDGGYANTGTTPLRASLTGLGLGLSVLVRPAMLASVLLFGLGFCALIVARVGWRNLRPRLVVVPGAFALSVFVCIVPWMIRNRVVFHAEYQVPNNQHVTPLGFKSPIASAHHLYVREFNRYLASYEQPFVALKTFTAPVVARYVYPGEEAEVRAAFAKLEADIKSTGTYRRESLVAFEQITKKRYRAAPRLYLTAPASLIAKIWVSPRVSVLFKDRSGHNSSTGLIVALTAYSSVYLLGFLGVWWGLRQRAAHTAIFLGAMVLGHTWIYGLWMPLPQARYAVVLYPLLSLAIGAFVEQLPMRLRFGRVEMKANSSA